MDHAAASDETLPDARTAETLPTGDALEALPVPEATRFGRYLLHDRLGAGGMGIVHRAYDTQLRRDVALKLLHSGEGASDELVQRFAREAQAAARLSHPNLVSTYDVGIEGGKHFLTMELVPGGSLADLVKRHGGRLPPADAMRIVREVSLGLSYAHGEGIVHRDLKPGNVLLQDLRLPGEGVPGSPPPPDRVRAKIADFGMARMVREDTEARLTVSGAILGTPAYMAPEAAEGRPEAIDALSDVYSLGAMLYELVTGSLPFPGTSLMEVLVRKTTEDPPTPRAVNPALARDVETIVLKATARERHRRYASAAELADDLGRCLAGEAIRARPESAWERGVRWMRRHPALAAGSAVAAALGIAALTWQATRGGELVLALDPPDAQVEIDGRAAGPVAQVSAGRHAVRVFAPDHEDIVREIDLRRGERRSAEFRLARAGGTVTIECDTEGAVVDIAGERHGTPVTRHPLPVGEIRARVRKRGHESRETTLAIRRGENAQAWVSLPPRRGWFQRVADGPASHVWLHDVDGDGFLDVHTSFYGHLYTYGGRSGTLLHDTEPGGLYTWSLHHDLDADGVRDEVTTHLMPGAEGKGGFLWVQAWSGHESDGGLARRRLWERRFPHDEPKPHHYPPATAGADLWIPVPLGLERLEGRSGRTLGSLLLGVPAWLAPVDGGDVLAGADTTLLRLGPSGEERWRVVHEHPVGLVGEHERLSPQVAGEGLAWLTDSHGGLLAIDVARGTVAWRVEAGEGASAYFVPPDGSLAGAIVLVSARGLHTCDLATGRETFRLDVPQAPALLSAPPGRILLYDGGELNCRSARDGAILWRRELVGKPACPGAWARVPAGLELYVGTDRRLLLVMDVAGRELREHSLETLPQRITPSDVDRDGRGDCIVTGGGVECVLSSRVLWKRPTSNAVRPRPLVIGTASGAVVVLAGTWEDGRKEMRGLRGSTGEVLWHFGGGHDAIWEPAVQDVDHDGTPDVGMHFTGETPGFHWLSARDGKPLRRIPKTALPYGGVASYDLDGDGEEELLLPSFQSGLQCWKFGRDEPLWSERCGGVMAAPLLCDLDGDRRPELVLAWGRGNRDAGVVAAYGLDGKVRWAVQIPEETRTSPARMDLDGNGTPEIFVAGCRNGWVLAADGSLRTQWTGMGGSYAPPTPVDADGDGKPEWLLGTATGVSLVRADGAPVWSYPSATVFGALGVATLPGHDGPAVVGADAAGRLFVLELRTGREAWRWETGEMCEGGVTLADLDGDGIPEAVFGSYDQHVYAVDLR